MTKRNHLSWRNDRASSLAVLASPFVAVFATDALRLHQLQCQPQQRQCFSIRCHGRKTFSLFAAETSRKRPPPPATQQRRIRTCANRAASHPMWSPRGLPILRTTTGRWPTRFHSCHAAPATTHCDRRWCGTDGGLHERGATRRRWPSAHRSASSEETRAQIEAVGRHEQRHK
jgi:hypothetical protein